MVYVYACAPIRFNHVICVFGMSHRGCFHPRETIRITITFICMFRGSDMHTLWTRQIDQVQWYRFWVVDLITGHKISLPFICNSNDQSNEIVNTVEWLSDDWRFNMKKKHSTNWLLKAIWYEDKLQIFEFIRTINILIMYMCYWLALHQYVMYHDGNLHQYLSAVSLIRRGFQTAKNHHFECSNMSGLSSQDTNDLVGLLGGTSRIWFIERNWLFFVKSTSLQFSLPLSNLS